MEAEPHVFISYRHPLAEKKIVNLDDLSPYPYLSFEQGQYNSFYFYEEILGSMEREKSIKVRDRATLFNLVVGLNGYTISSGIIDKELNGEQIIARKLNVKEKRLIKKIVQKMWPSKNLHTHVQRMFLQGILRIIVMHMHGQEDKTYGCNLQCCMCQMAVIKPLRDAQSLMDK